MSSKISENSQYEIDKQTPISPTDDRIFLYIEVIFFVNSGIFDFSREKF